MGWFEEGATKLCQCGSKMIPRHAGAWEGVPNLLHWIWRCHGCGSNEYGGNTPIRKTEVKPISPQDDAYSEWIAAQTTH
jgi:hypothetical protein